MKKVVLILLICVSIPSASQNNLSETKKLAITAKVWGFLKYYHQNVAEGKYEWDQQLFKILEKVEQSSDKETFSKVFVTWINSLGNLKHCKKCNKKNDDASFNKNFDLTWLENELYFTKELSDKLRFIETNRHLGQKHYAYIPKNYAGQIGIRNELEYKNFDWKDKNLRLLTLFRYWNIVEYFFPYKYQTDTKWDDVLIEMIPKFLNSKTEIELHAAMLELVVNIDDSHSRLSSEKAAEFIGNYWIPAYFRIIDNKAIITGFYNDSLALKDDIRKGDIITMANGKTIESIFNEKKDFISGSNLPRKKLNAFSYIFNGSSDSVQITFERNGESNSKTIKRYLYQDFNYKSKRSSTYKIFDGNIGYIDMKVLSVKDVPMVMKKLENTKAIIFDIRNYPKTTMRYIETFITSKRQKFYKPLEPNINYPGKFVWKRGTSFGKNQELPYKGKLVALVNEYSQSYAEFVTMAFQTADNLTTIGSQTSGADGNVSRFEMVGGYKTQMSGIGIFYPDGTETQRKGVKIDIEIKPTLKGMIEGKDEVLDKAIEFLNN